MVECWASLGTDCLTPRPNGGRAHHVLAAMSAFQNNKAVVMLEYQANPMGVQLFSYVNTSFVPINLHGCWTRSGYALYFCPAA